MIDLASVSWSLSDLKDGLPRLAQDAGLQPADVALEQPRVGQSADSWLHEATKWLQLGVQTLNWSYRDYAALLRVAAPAILRVAVGDESRYLLLRQRGQRQIVLLRPDYKTERVSVRTLAGQLREEVAGEFAVALDALLETVEFSAEMDPRTALLAEQLNGKQITGCWLLQPASHAPLRQQLRQARITPVLALLFGITLLQQIITLASWTIIGQGALEQDFATNTLMVWVLILLTGIPISIMGLWAQGVLTLNSGQLFRSRLLVGILNLRPSVIRNLGSGQFLERVIKTESFQTALLGGGVTALLAFVQLVIAVAVLALGAGGLLHAFILVVWGGFVLFSLNRYAKGHSRLSDTYRDMTNHLVERMLGQRTRLAQQPPEQWHTLEDIELEQFQHATRRADRWQLVLNALVGRGWLLVGLLGIVPPFLAETPDITALAISVGGILLASNALSAITAGALSLAHAQQAWRDVAPLLTVTSPQLGTRTPGEGPEQGMLLVARDVVFRHRPNAAPVLRGVDLDIAVGERLLLEGVSGSGKSTLATILTGMSEPDSGMLLLHGLDQQTMGHDNWHQRIVAAPQFYENHILTETVAFNLLLGRRWPPTEQDLSEAKTICYELGLGSLLEQMPSGLQQMLGEGGWQLSHGERSRLFIARALLQQADLVVLDESFSALDAENLRLALDCVQRRAPTLLVIAHP